MRRQILMASVGAIAIAIAGSALAAEPPVYTPPAAAAAADLHLVWPLFGRPDRLRLGQRSRR